MIKVAIENLNQIEDLLIKMSIEEYTAQPSILFGASIGQHTRHIIEFYQILIAGANSGSISYDVRIRDNKIGDNIPYAIQKIKTIKAELDKLPLDTALELVADYTTIGNSEAGIPSSTSRELAYCIEHSIHHQALIKSALIALGKEEYTDKDFGVAYSTIRYREAACAQ